ncbi:MAG: phosphoglycerate dehydrogenase [Deltaproteobacteria bacterium GWA2_38_16]|nr:MAG: phosphoglycerate dehydrogenase [Deltaproteobacteria bacterium GWA2_38_16]OGQ02496.1 MAG: phosphoglycerate dehydrogenase [Deltaproteobacteria bacterium RIFCSPHIGHO2_02_FULL_38_15]OGQ33213.1 MAG: phosphoglycerate dehydrogenase [Deltaproteobacteria bacterium RIFCSPLOWO2_01_FULL_38_9]
MIRILVCGKLSEAGMSLLSKEKNLKVDIESDLTAEKLKEIIPLYDAMTVRSETKVTKDVLDCAKKLKVVVRAGIGVDNIDVKAATQKGVIVMNTPSGNVVTTAEHAISMLLALCRHIPQATASLKKGEWAKKKFTGVEFFGKTLGVVGLGNVGRIVADRALGLKMKVIAYDPFISQEIANKLSVQLVSLEDLLKQSDFVTIHVPLTEQTKNLINKKTLQKMKKGALLIHCARGGIVNEEDLYEVLKEGNLGGAALDVFVKEPPGNHPLFMLDTVIGTPHLGAATDEAQIKVGIETAEQLISYFNNGAIKNAVNMPSLTPEQVSLLKPYVECAEKLGAFEGQVMGLERLKSIEIEYTGALLEQDVKPVTLALVKSFLEQHLDKSVNFVNALFVAKERGIEIKVTTSQKSSDFTSLISARVKANGHEMFVAGTIFNNSEPRIVQVDNFRLEAIPEGHILFSRNQDKPGVIGAIGTLLGKKKINISRFHLGLDKQKKEALSLINVDSPVDEHIIEELSKLPHVIMVKQLSL